MDVHHHLALFTNRFCRGKNVNICNSFDTGHVCANRQSLIRRWNFPRTDFFLATVFFKNLSLAVCCGVIKYWYFVSELHKLNKLCRRCISTPAPVLRSFATKWAWGDSWSFHVWGRKTFGYQLVVHETHFAYPSWAWQCRYKRSVHVGHSNAVCNCVV